MPDMIVEPRRSPVALQAGIISELAPAFSDETKRLTQQANALRAPQLPTTARSVEDVRDLPERLFDARASAKILTAAVAMHLDSEGRERLFRQIDSLHDPEEWEEGDEPLQQSSFATFLKAILTIGPEVRPGLGLSRSGHLIAAWTRDRDRLTVEFLPNDRVIWVLARYKDDEPSRFAGQTPVSELAGGLAPHHPEHWFSNEGRKRPESSR
jgi:hypothetical protein